MMNLLNSLKQLIGQNMKKNNDKINLIKIVKIIIKKSAKICKS